MPRSSIEGSAFPNLEQERRSVAHTDRGLQRGKAESQELKQGENERKSERIDAGAS